MSNAYVSPLHRAVAVGDVNTVRWMICLEVFRNQRGPLGRTPQHFAALRDDNAGETNAEIIGLLLVGDGANSRDEQGNTPLHLAAMKGHMQAMERLVLLWIGHRDVNMQNNYGQTPLRLASSRCHVPSMKFLLEHGADVDVPSRNGWTCLHVVASVGNMDALKLLLNRGANVDAVAKDGTTPFLLACLNNRVAAARMLLDEGANTRAPGTCSGALQVGAAGNSILHLVCAAGHAAVARLLLTEGGADPWCTNRAGHTPLFLSVSHNRTEVTKLLVSLKSDERCLNDVFSVMEASSVEAARFLFENAETMRGSSLLHAAARRGRTKSLQQLLKCGVLIDVATDIGNTPLHVATIRNQLAAIEFLLEHGASCVSNALGRTPLHISARDGRVDSARLLLRAADVDARDIHGATALHLAAERGHEPMVVLLLCHGANRDVLLFSSGNTPSDLARREGHEECVDVLRRDRDPQRDRFTLLLAEVHTSNKARRDLESKLEASGEAALASVLAEATTEMESDGGWATLRPADPAEEAQALVDKFVPARAALATVTSTPGTPASDIAQCRAECCAAAIALLERLPPLKHSASQGDEARCVSGIEPLPQRPSSAAIAKVAEQMSLARELHNAPLAAVPEGSPAPIAATIKAALRANAKCLEAADSLRTALAEARGSFESAIGMSAEECGRLRVIAVAVVATEGPWSGAVGLQRRADTLTSLRSLEASLAAASKAAQRATRAVTKAVTVLADAQSDDDESVTVDDAKVCLARAQEQRDAAQASLLEASAAVQAWATSGDGALALKAFPGDAELTAAIDGLLPAEFTAETALPQTPGVSMATEYPSGLTECAAAAGVVFFAERVGFGAVVLRRLPLGSPERVALAVRQLQDAGRIAVGLKACADALSGCPSVVFASRWFVAAAIPGSAPDVWLEFPRAPSGSLAEALLKGKNSINAAAAADLCLRLVRAVAQMHAAGIRHGDLNPSNVVLWDDPTTSTASLRPGIIDLLDTVNVGATRTLRGFTAEWLPPEAAEAITRGETVAGTRALDCWQLGRICQAVLAAAKPNNRLRLGSIRKAVDALVARNPDRRPNAADAFIAVDKAVLGAKASAADTGLQWALPPSRWLCQRGAASGVDFVTLKADDPAAKALTRHATSVSGRRVRAVHRLENVQLWHVYASERARVASTAGASWPERLNMEGQQMFGPRTAQVFQELTATPWVQSGHETYLFHGAPQQSHRLIAEGGLDPSYSGGRVGALFGAATCLTPSLNKAANEYAKRAGDGVFVTRVAVGRVADRLTAPYRETSQYRRPPDGYHSVLGDNGTPGAVVAVYRPSRMYPEYLVVFDNDFS